MSGIDYSSKMHDELFSYDSDFHPTDGELPDPQKDPIIPGARVRINKVGIAPVDLPIRVFRRDGSEQTLQAKASLYCSLDSSDLKGLNLSRLYLLMHETIKDQLSLQGIKAALHEMATKQGSNNAYCKLRFRYPMTQEALRSRAPLKPDEPFQTLADGEKVSFNKLVGHIAYDVTLEGRFHRADPNIGYSEDEYKFFMTLDYTYSSTCPCSYELAKQAKETRDIAANAHSQRSVMTTTVQFDPDAPVSIEDLVDLHRKQIPTEVQIVVKRRDEQAFAELNGTHLLFSEDAVRLMYQGLDGWYDDNKISDFSVSTCHQESLHPWDAIAVITKGIPGGLS